jgi:hypothetical protein
MDFFVRSREEKIFPAEGFFCRHESKPKQKFASTVLAARKKKKVQLMPPKTPKTPKQMTDRPRRLRKGAAARHDAAADDGDADGEVSSEKKTIKRQRVGRRTTHKPTSVGPRVSALGNLAKIGGDIVCGVFRCLDLSSHIALTRVCCGLRELATRDAARPSLIHIWSTANVRTLSASAFARALAKLMPAKRLVSELQLLTGAVRFVLRNHDLQRHLRHLSISVAPACNIGADAFVGFVSLQSLCVVATGWAARGWHEALEALPPSVMSLELRDNKQSRATLRGCANQCWTVLPPTVTTLRIGVDRYGSPGLCDCSHPNPHPTTVVSAALKRNKIATDDADTGLHRYEFGHAAGCTEWKRLLQEHPRLRVLRLANLDLTLQLASEWCSARRRQRRAMEQLGVADDGDDTDELRVRSGDGDGGGSGGGGGADQPVHGEVERYREQRKSQKIGASGRHKDATLTVGPQLPDCTLYETLRVLVAPLHSTFTFWALLLSLPSLHTALLRRSRLVKAHLDTSDDDDDDD